MIQITILQAREQEKLLVPDRNRQLVFGEAGWVKKGLITQTIQTHPEAPVELCSILTLSIGSYQFSSYRKPRAKSLKLDSKTMIRSLLGEVAPLLADCSTDCDCSKRCSLALTD